MTLHVCVSLSVRALKGKMDRAIDTKLGTLILHGSGLACVDSDVRRSKVKVTREGLPVVRLLGFLVLRKAVRVPAAVIIS